MGSNRSLWYPTQNGFPTTATLSVNHCSIQFVILIHISWDFNMSIILDGSTRPIIPHTMYWKVGADELCCL